VHSRAREISHARARERSLVADYRLTRVAHAREQGTANVTGERSLEISHVSCAIAAFAAFA